MYLAVVVLLALMVIAFFNLRPAAEQNTVENLPTTDVYTYETDFPTEYIEKNKNNIQVEIPRVYELLHIVIALTDSAQEHKYNLNYNSEYFQAVQSHFQEYSDHPAVKEYEKIRAEYSYSNPRMLFTYEFNNNEVTASEVYDFKVDREDADAYAKLLTDFAQKSNFNQFYNKHKSYYQEKIKEFEKYTNLKRSWQWLEENYPVSYDSYKVILSPLVFGSHNTIRFGDSEENYNEIVMFVSTAELFTFRDIESEALISALTERMVFTEIDHNYVNPVTDKKENMKKIMEVFGNLDKWNNKSGNYSKRGLTFNEYMTWGTACLYTYEYYEPAVYEEFIHHTKESMKYRGFVKFPEFYEELLTLYKESDKPIAELYPELLERVEGI